jgi:NADPH:quinone reductase-like Zn-dependent oxidoreductase
MKAFVVGRYGSEAGVRMREVPEPDVGEHDVLVEVRAASVNPLDAKIRDGEFKLILPYRVPFVLGHDMAGQVVRVGSAVRSFAPGDEVYARPRKDRIGTFAELIAVHEDDLALKPSTLTMVEAAALPLVALTAWQGLVERANVRPGQKVLVHAGSGGVGTIAIQLAKHLGAYVATTAGTANVTWVQGLGADVVVDYRRDDFETILRDYDVVLDSLGGETLEKSLRVLKPGGIAIGLDPRSGPCALSAATSWPGLLARPHCGGAARDGGSHARRAGAPRARSRAAGDGRADARRAARDRPPPAPRGPSRSR